MLLILDPPCDKEVEAYYVAAIGSKYGPLGRERVWGAAGDGLKVKIQHSNNWAIQIMHYNSWATIQTLVV